MLTILHVMNNKVDMLQTQTKLLNANLKSLNGDIKESDDKVALATCALEFFYFFEPEVDATLN